MIVVGPDYSINHPNVNILLTILRAFVNKFVEIVDKISAEYLLVNKFVNKKVRASQARD